MKVVIAGAGAVGTHLSKLLSTENHDCVLIDDDEGRLSGIDSKFDIMAINASPTSIKTLKDAVLDNRVPNEREPLMELLRQKAREMGLKEVNKE